MNDSSTKRTNHRLKTPKKEFREKTIQHNHRLKSRNILQVQHTQAPLSNKGVSRSTNMATRTVSFEVMRLQ